MMAITSRHKSCAEVVKLRERVIPLSPSGTATRTDYAGNLVYRDGLLGRILVDGGSVVAKDSTFAPAYEFAYTDHLGSGRALVTVGDSLYRKTEYGPYGEILSETWTSQMVSLGSGGNGNGGGLVEEEGEGEDAGEGGGSRSVNLSPLQTRIDNPYRFGGKERLDAASLDLYDFGARHFTPSLPRWLTMDPLCEKYYGVSPYVYCAGNPVNLVDPSGEGPIGRLIYRATSYYLEFQTNNHDLRTIGYVMDNPYVAYKLGPGKEFFNGISAVAGKFAINMMNAAGLKENREGTPMNAFRHTLWQAMIVSEFGEGSAIRVGNAHEDNTDLDLSQRLFEDIGIADTAADLLNNSIGREIVSEKPNLSNKDLAYEVLSYYYNNGLWMVKETDSGYQLYQQRLTEEEYIHALFELFRLHENGLKK